MSVEILQSHLESRSGVRIPQWAANLSQAASGNSRMAQRPLGNTAPPPEDTDVNSARLAPLLARRTPVDGRSRQFGC